MSIETANGTRDHINALYTFLKSNKSLLKINDEQFEKDIEDCTVKTGGFNEGEEGTHLYSMHYRAVIFIDRLKSGFIPYLMALVTIHLEQAENENNNIPPVDYEFLKLDKDGKYYNIEIYIDLIDPVYISKNENGPIQWEGESWDIAENKYWLAEEGQVDGEFRDVEGGGE